MGEPGARAAGARELWAAPVGITPAGQGLTALFGLAGVFLLLVVFVHFVARRQGGWRALGRRLRREAAATLAAFAAPFRAQLRYRRQLRLLVRLLGRTTGWADAERAVMAAGAVRAGVRPYGVLLGTDLAGVMVACGPAAPPEPPEPWFTDERDPRLWWIDRADIPAHVNLPVPTSGAGAAARAGWGRGANASAGAGVGAGPVAEPEAAPLLVALGVDGDGAHVVLLDVLSGPPALALDGEPRTVHALAQAIAAQVDTRLPPGAVVVADGVSPYHPGPDAARAVAMAAAAASTGIPAFAVCAQAPAEPLPAGVRVIAADGVRGTARLLTAGADGRVLVHGTPVLADAVALPAALRHIVTGLPPYAPAGPPPATAVAPGLITSATPAAPASPAAEPGGPAVAAVSAVSVVAGPASPGSAAPAVTGPASAGSAPAVPPAPAATSGRPFGYPAGAVPAATPVARPDGGRADDDLVEPEVTARAGGVSVAQTPQAAPSGTAP
ncbi:hypothetical protein ACFFWE_10590 [Sphaerisporangium melleum]|nr:hypothetical protein [Sphaerisporangium melleum]